jgi:predicted secreted protein
MTSFRRILTTASLGALASTCIAFAPAQAAGGAVHHVSYAPTSYTVKVGHKVTVTLKTASDGGYGWAITQGARSAKFTVLSKKVVSAATPGTVGGYSRTVYVLRAKKTGNATFKAVERRSFDKTDVIDRFTLHLHITRS